MLIHTGDTPTILTSFGRNNDHFALLQIVLGNLRIDATSLGLCRNVPRELANVERVLCSHSEIIYDQAELASVAILGIDIVLLIMFDGGLLDLLLVLV